jgi:lipoprotein NlpI
VDQKKLELAMQVLKELKKDEPEDPYTMMSKKLDGAKADKKEKRNFALRHATEQEEEKKGSQSSEQEVSSGSERERA